MSDRPFSSGGTNVKFYWMQTNDVKSNSVNCHVRVACVVHRKVFRNFDGIGI